MIPVEVLLFAGAAHLAERRAVSLVIPHGGTIAEVASALVSELPQLADLVAISRWAIASDFVALDTPLHQSTTVALIPPTSGG